MSEPKLKTAEDVYEDALALSETERERLKSMLTNAESSGWASPEIEQAWMDEAQRRSKLRAEGKSRSIPGDEFFAELRRKYAE